ncbi:Inositol-1-monophosphatase [Candidatus Arsenophonus lipoptenae]|uniref:Inositol-1-monophosphatase n=1 Tax=Candidatus Arsenophonus lipoptenae TaxID=634113 RepID=A0A0X8CXD8_9GAMM|nr:inositol-1-monophosphatase [Candidatus Arsenophonus lipoptenae]AMA64707.1 Inositol-1-monophosphatase [Candidatus Arsenophonus lipoptenae]
MHPMLTIAIRAVRQAGDFINKNYENYNVLKKQNNFLTNIDKKVKQIIITTIKKSYPTHTIITKERYQIIDKKNSIQWIINPLDGIINFIKLLPNFSVSIAVRINCRTEIAAIYNPILNELFTAVRGQGAQLNNYRLRIKNNNELKVIIIATGFPFKKQQNTSMYIDVIIELIKKYTNLYSTGVISLDLAYVAAGRIDAVFKVGLKPYDFMAGELLIRESGGIVTDFLGGYNYLSSGNFLAGNLSIVKKIITEIKQYLKY